jgi:hypothetical protein
MMEPCIRTSALSLVGVGRASVQATLYGWLVNVRTGTLCATEDVVNLGCCSKLVDGFEQYR